MNKVYMIIVVFIIGLSIIVWWGVDSATSARQNALKGALSETLLGIYVYDSDPEYRLHLKSYTFANTNHPINIVAQRYWRDQPYENDFILERWEDSVYRAKYPETNEFAYFTVIKPGVIKQTSENNPDYFLHRINGRTNNK